MDRQLTKTEHLINQLHDRIAREALLTEADQIRSDLREDSFHLVVFGTASAGKTSLVNALLGRWVGETAATMGTTQMGSSFTYTIAGVTGTVLLTDTPGLQTIGQQGEAEAKTLAQLADLLVFVVAGDLLASEYEVLLELARRGKRAILTLNKTDQILPEDTEAILAKLRSRTGTVIPADHVVDTAANPQPLKVKYLHSDGTQTIEYEDQPPDVQKLVTQLARVLQRDGQHLHLANALLRSEQLSASAAEILHQQQTDQAQEVIDRMQWATAAAVAVTPLPAVDLLAAAAINGRMVSELHRIFERPISLQEAKAAAQAMGQMVLKLGGVELATQVVGSALKTSPLALVGIPLQAISGAYLTRVAGLIYLDHLSSGQPWQEETMQQRVKEQLQHLRHQDVISQLLGQALERLPIKVRRSEPPSPSRSPWVAVLPSSEVLRPVNAKQEQDVAS
ncbi:MAG: DUF697 domain-containing protein [Synechococcaceae cyanobacterium SM2_3_1]|nr:DUF697 domain-containing protein [Synechococcaceae cyanobacterium SM2_3_1]